MSIASELTNLESNIGDAYDAVNDMSGIIPQHKNMANLDQAIRTIPQNPGTTYTAGNGINIDANNEISIDDTVVAELSDLPGVMTGATSGTAGTSGLVPSPAVGDDTKYLKGDGTWASVFDMIYPVGSIYMSVNNTDPGTLFGGTWTQIQDSFILAAGSTYAGGSTGGSATINLAHSHTVNSHNHSLPANTGSHTLTVDEIPSHDHPFIVPPRYGWEWGDGGAMYGQKTSTSANNTQYTGDTGGGQGHTHTIGGNTGDKSPGTNSQLSSAQSILPPYLAVYVWKRTA